MLLFCLALKSERRLGCCGQTNLGFQCAISIGNSMTSSGIWQ